MILFQAVRPESGANAKGPDLGSIGINTSFLALKRWSQFAGSFHFLVGKSLARLYDGNCYEEKNTHLQVSVISV